MGGPVLHSGNIIGLNLKVIPDLNDRINRKQLNSHLNILPYKFFINNVINNENEVIF
jgi:hypothetical protein